MRYFWIFLFVCRLALAQPPAFVYNRPNFPTDKVLNALEQQKVKQALHKDRNLIMKELIPAKNDYVGDYDRGTVHFNPKKGVNYLGREVFEASNYSYHKVIIPKGTTIKEVNFSQKLYDTDAIQGEDLIFDHCNLVNVLVHPSWTLISCNTTQKKEEIVGSELITYNRDKNNKWIEVEREAISP